MGSFQSQVNLIRSAVISIIRIQGYVSDGVTISMSEKTEIPPYTGEWNGLGHASEIYMSDEYGLFHLT